ncbi:MAG: DotU family type IV/VI secretion system protein [Sedimentisphaerales bacterium]|nr:DotU family type IV/VI secretion system protein [Sedimentisphaerales bacterium]
MSLLGLCEPAFQYVCRLHRSAQKGCTLDIHKVRSEIKQILDQTKSTAAAKPEAASQYEKVELPLIFFIDFMAKERKLGFGADWVELASERQELAGDEKFFDLLDIELADPSKAATERLAVYYTCLGLGFTGIYFDEPEMIRKLMSRISARLAGITDGGQKSYLCPQAYENVDTRDFTEPPGRKLTYVAIGLVSLVIVWLVVYVGYFWSAARQVSKDLKIVNEAKAESSVQHGNEK